MKVSYLITCSTETDTLKNLLKVIVAAKKTGNTDDDEIIILLDKHHAIPSNETYNIIAAFHHFEPCYIDCTHALDDNYGAHKNYGIEKCTGDYIFQLDGDEMPPEALLGENLHALLESNPTIEAYAIPRINDFRGVTEIHAKQWGWRLSESPSLKRTIVNFPDYQWRIFKRDFPRIGFTRKLHEKIEGYDSYVALPADEDYAILHNKTIEKQIETNLNYNKRFTADENRGHSVFR